MARISEEQQHIVHSSEQGSDNFFWEREFSRRGWLRIAGVDEAGRGPLAGPVVAASVILPHPCAHQQFLDSKMLSAARRNALYEELFAIGAQIGVGIASAQEVDRLNILHASFLAMKRAVENMPELPDVLLVDGKFKAPLPLAQQALIKGERRSASIAAASIVAKVTRDQIMDRFDELYPAYQFRRHKGYPTKDHRRTIHEHGPCPIHRRTFKGVREFFHDTDKRVPFGLKVETPLSQTVLFDHATLRSE